MKHIPTFLNSLSKPLILILCLVVFGKTEAQNMKPIEGLSVGDMFKLSSSYKKHSGILGHDSNYYYGIFKDYRHGIYKFDKNLNYVNEQHLKLDNKLRGRTFEYMSVFYDTIYVFYSERRFKKTELYVQKINKQTLERLGDEKLLFTELNVKGNYAEFEFYESLERKKLLILSTTEIFLSKTIMLDFRVYGEGLLPAWHREEFVEYNHQSPRDFQYVLDDEGNVHFITMIYEIMGISNLMTQDPLKNKYLVVSIVDDGNKLVQNDIAIENNFIRKPILSPGSNASFSCVGFYTDEAFPESRKGVFTAFSTANSSNIAAIRLNNFSDELMAKLYREPAINRGNELFSYESKFLVPRANGNFIYVAQQEYQQQDYDNVNDVIIMAFNQHGDKLWESVINKRQSGYEGVSLSMSAPLNKVGVTLVYNDNIKNDFSPAYYKDKKSMGFPGPSKLVAATINAYGNIEFEVLNERYHRKVPMSLITKTYDTKDGRLIFYCKRDYKHHLMQKEFE